jgi:3-oxoacyl-[acyl-carrier-protein] synthase III
MLDAARTRPAHHWTHAPSPVRRAGIRSVAIELPEGRITNDQLGERFGVGEGWILSRTGIRERCQAAPDERLSDYATRAAAKALDRASVAPADVDLVIVATTTADELQPNTAPLVAHGIGTLGAGAFDVGSGCTGLLSAIAAATAQIETSRAEHVVVVGADFITRINNYDDRRIGPVFADGAGAMLLGPSGPQTDRTTDPVDAGLIGPVVLGSDGSQADTIIVTHEERKIHMDGPEVFRHAVQRMGEVTMLALERAGLGLDDIDLFVYHQANARITRTLGQRLGLPAERVVDCIEHYGNASAATIPVALIVALEDGRLREGANVLLCAFGSGFTWGAGVVRWGTRRA